MRFKTEEQIWRDQKFKKWFAWFPVEINDEMVWLEFVERKYHLVNPGFFEWGYWIYRHIPACPKAGDGVSKTL